MDESNTETSIPSYRVLELTPLGEDMLYVFLYNLKRFYIDLRQRDLVGPGSLLNDFKSFRDNIDDPEIIFQFEDWVMDALKDFMREVAPNPEPGPRKALTLLEYFSAPTFAFHIINQEGNLYPVQEPYDPLLHGCMGPRTRIVDSPLNLENRHQDTCAIIGNTKIPLETKEVIVRSEFPTVPLILASELERIDDGLPDDELSDIPTKVRRIGTEDIFFFKAGFRDHGHIRELEILSKIGRQSDQFKQPFLTSKLAGLVVWNSNEPFLLGFLLHYIEGETLAKRMRKASIAEKTKWFQQTEATMRLLHGNGIVWGDAKPDNVVINLAGDAVIIDFGGGYTPDYVEPELQQTFQGDILTLENMGVKMGVIL
ncbi:hypothetical protein M426DRAFT_265610 [Hypoxylon sp. CI-4A]|nr:hypothetical protein M426DRAFT_265610 [Hypoxylon sp. CI-4A]